MSASTNFQVTDCNSFWKIQFSLFPIVTNFDLAIKYVKVTLVSSLEQIKMGWSPRCYIQSFVEISLPILEMIFEGFFPYKGGAAILVMWPASCHEIFISLYLKALI